MIPRAFVTEWQHSAPGTAYIIRKLDKNRNTISKNCTEKW